MLFSNKFIRSVSTLSVGTFVSQVLMVIIAPLLTRLYAPSDIGLFSLYATLLSVLSVLSGLRYQLAIPLPETNQEAIEVVRLSVIGVLIISLLTSITIHYGIEISLLLNTPQLSEFLWVLPVGVFFTGTYQVFSNWAIRIKAFRAIAITNILQTVVIIIIQVLGYRIGAFSLILGSLLGQIIAVIYLCVKSLPNKAFSDWSLKQIWVLAKRYRYFPYFSTWSALINAAGAQLPLLLIASFFSINSAGLYALANRVVASPIPIIGDAIGKVFFANASEKRLDGTLGNMTFRVFKILCTIGLPPTFALIIGGPFIFVSIFGEEWRQAGEFASLMAPWMFFVFTVSPLSTLFLVLERQGVELILQLIFISARIIAIMVGVWLNNLNIGVMLFSYTSAIYWFLILVWVMISVNVSLIDVVKEIGKTSILGFLCTIPLLLLLDFKPLHDYWIAFILISFFLILIMYGMLIKKVKNGNI